MSLEHAYSAGKWKCCDCGCTDIVIRHLPGTDVQTSQGVVSVDPVGIPQCVSCGEVGNAQFQRACDVSGCTKDVVGGRLTSGGYMHLCRDHWGDEP